MTKIKLDENFSPSLTKVFHSSGFDAHSVLEENLCGATDKHIFEVCTQEERCLITFDTDFCNILNYPADNTAGIIVVRPNRPISFASISDTVEKITDLLKERSPKGCLWVLEPDRLRIRYPDQA